MTPPLVAGETLIDFLPATDGSTDDVPLAEVERFDRRAGGAPANVAVGLARLNRPPLFWTRLGVDPFGEHLANRLAAEGIPDRFVERDPVAATTLAFLAGEASADQDAAARDAMAPDAAPADPTADGVAPRFTFYRDGTADTRMQEGTVPDETLAATPWVHAGGVALADEPARSATLDLLDRAADAGCTVSFDPNVRPELWGNEAELATVCGWAIEAADVLIATPAELRTLGYAGEDPSALARAALGEPGGDHGSTGDDRESTNAVEGPDTVVLTLGDAGAIATTATDAAESTDPVRHGGFDVDAVDATGAGDAFTAGLIDAMLRGEPIEEALAFANAVAALSTTERGAMTALPDRGAVATFVED